MRLWHLCNPWRKVKQNKNCGETVLESVWASSKGWVKQLWKHLPPGCSFKDRINVLAVWATFSQAFSDLQPQTVAPFFQKRIGGSAKGIHWGAWLPSQCPQQPSSSERPVTWAWSRERGAFAGSQGHVCLASTHSSTSYPTNGLCFHDALHQSLFAFLWSVLGNCGTPERGHGNLWFAAKLKDITVSLGTHYSWSVSEGGGDTGGWILEPAGSALTLSRVKSGW